MVAGDHDTAPALLAGNDRLALPEHLIRPGDRVNVAAARIAGQRIKLRDRERERPKVRNDPGASHPPHHSRDRRRGLDPPRRRSSRPSGALHGQS